MNWLPTENDISEKIEVLNIYNTIQNKNNPIKFKLDKKNMIRKTKTNSVQINNKKEFLSSFNLQKEKLPGTNIEIDIINIENNNLVKYNKNSKKIFLNNKTQSNSEAKLIKDINNKNNILNTFTSKSLKKDNLNNNNEKKENNNDNNNNLNANDMKKINVKEMKEKYHKLLRGNKVTHGSYDTTSRLHLLKKFRVLNNPIGSMNTNINKTIISNKKRSPVKKNILSPSEKIQNTMSNYIKSPIKNKFNLSNKNTSIENYNVVGGNKFHLIGKKNKQVDTNNKKMKFIKK